MQRETDVSLSLADSLAQGGENAIDAVDASTSAPTRSTCRRVASWNLGGQPLSKTDAVVREYDILCLQEVPRGEVGWDEEHTDGFAWLMHRSDVQ